jgi:small subunit ribosomal protein S9
MANAKKKNFTYAKGKRKESAARVRLIKGKGELTVNGKPYSQYFPGIRGKLLLENLLNTIDAGDKYYATVRVVGGGKNGQLDAVVHGLAKAFNTLSREKFRPALKKAGFLTRDPRQKQRRMVGTGGKARRKKQSPKR